VTGEKLHPESLVVAAGRPHDAGGPLNTPIVLAAPWRHGVDGANAYAREQPAPTVRAFEEALGALEGGTALAFASGMAAVAAVAGGLPVGSVAVVPAATYSGTVWDFAARAELGQLTTRSVDSADTDAVVSALDGADLLWVESVSNPLLAVPDLPALIAAAHARDALVAVDATFSTPLNLRALDLGADIVMHSATKFLSGHSDVIMGALVVRSGELAADLHDRRTRTGAIPGALEAYLATRGLRTLALRWERAQANAMTLAQRLAAHSRVRRVRYPGLPSDPGHAIAARDHAGFGAIISFELHGSADDAEQVCNTLRLISHATSLGGVESLIERRARHAGDAGFGTPETLLRLSVGIEHVDDLWTDLTHALDSRVVRPS
jgi:cystathionine gamma-synthase